MEKALEKGHHYMGLLRGRIFEDNTRVTPEWDQRSTGEKGGEFVVYGGPGGELLRERGASRKGHTLSKEQRLHLFSTRRNVWES